MVYGNFKNIEASQRYESFLQTLGKGSFLQT